ncbi:L-threonylcarbamoyladenylate synthase [Cryobacterium sp. PH31-O1]|uniref:L-threonylcarbamoyladenylate synthase n=1 Tax=Cryobacterium sp. PH31-O1 TaxID=3046306 RepID=UPI0024BB8B7A|nr:L-threonylcarbamoyladenylate synthase [Cryobacterium sp. PH31-O1]MDJ0339395.1 L-threonylcarbamoyladenylate synthase [Cryobacterium sp. PH31-O1]
MTRIYDCTSESDTSHSDTSHSNYQAHISLARMAIGRGALVVIPTDTVYGVAADAFNAEAVQLLLDAKGRSRQSPPPVLIPGIPTLDALAVDVPQPVRDLVAAFWPGGLTVIVNAQPSLVWDLGETRGTVALRMPSNQIALDLLAATGPLAVSSANLSGMPATRDAQAAEAALGESIEVYLDGGTAGSTYESVFGESGEGSSTIVDATGFETNGGFLHIVRSGVISEDAIAAVVGDVLAAAPASPGVPTEPSEADATPTIAAPSQDAADEDTRNETDAGR